MWGRRTDYGALYAASTLEWLVDRTGLFNGYLQVSHVYNQEAQWLPTYLTELISDSNTYILCWSMLSFRVPRSSAVQLCSTINSRLVIKSATGVLVVHGCPGMDGIPSRSSRRCGNDFMSMIHNNCRSKNWDSYLCTVPTRLRIPQPHPKEVIQEQITTTIIQPGKGEYNHNQKSMFPNAPMLPSVSCLNHLSAKRLLVFPSKRLALF